jgi:cobalt-zinc-cadmium efflux system protein
LDCLFNFTSIMLHHTHNHNIQVRRISRIFVAGIALNLVFVLIEFIAGIKTNSLALMSDAGHNLSDVATLSLSWFALRMSSWKATAKFTYGFHKSTILASLANAVLLLIAVGAIGWEAVQRFLSPEETNGRVISIVAGIGIIINSVSALLFFRDRNTDLNMKGAFLHLALDAAVSAGVVIAGLFISLTGIKWIDPMISLIIMAVILYSTWSVLMESLRLSLDAVPQSIDPEKIRSEIAVQKGVSNVDHLHIWAMSTTRNAMTVHVTFDPVLSLKEVENVKSRIRQILDELNIQHVTIETDYKDD